MRRESARDRFERRRAFVRALYRGLHAFCRRRHCSLADGCAWMRRRLGLDLEGWHALTNATSKAKVPPVVLERLQLVTATWSRPLRAEEWE